MSDLHCKTCCQLDISCCKNPRIMWTIDEFRTLLKKYPDKLVNEPNIIPLKSEIEGILFLVDVDMAGKKADYCCFYDTKKMNCSVYEARPFICSSYGDPKYNRCPYEDLTEKELIVMAQEDPQQCEDLHDIKFHETDQELISNHYQNQVTSLPTADLLLWNKLQPINWVMEGEEENQNGK